MNSGNAEMIGKYEEEVAHLERQCVDLTRERRQLYVLLAGVAVSPLGCLYRPVAGLGSAAFFVTVFLTGTYFNFVHRNERAGQLEEAREALERLRESASARVA
jgi:hypothetical protein